MPSRTRQIASKESVTVFRGQSKVLHNTYAPKISHGLYSGTNTMAGAPKDLKRTLNPTLIEDVRNFWFGHINGEDALILPGKSEMIRWFSHDADFDKTCMYVRCQIYPSRQLKLTRPTSARFQPTLDAIIFSGASASQVLDAVDTSSPLTWLSLILLLDQLPRNCYRGDVSKLVFNCFDPLAEKIALRAIDAGVPMQSPDVRYRLSYRFWFHLPLMHSEDLSVHEQAMKVYENTANDMKELFHRDIATLDANAKRCYDVLSSQRDALEIFLSSIFDFEKRHKVIIERFGRYPHRNQVLGRVSTEEEIEYLESGGETFS